MIQMTSLNKMIMDAYFHQGCHYNLCMCLRCLHTPRNHPISHNFEHHKLDNHGSLISTHKTAQSLMIDFGHLHRSKLRIVGNRKTIYNKLWKIIRRNENLFWIEMIFSYQSIYSYSRMTLHIMRTIYPIWAIRKWYVNDVVFGCKWFSSIWKSIPGSKQ